MYSSQSAAGQPAGTFAPSELQSSSVSGGGVTPSVPQPKLDRREQAKQMKKLAEEALRRLPVNTLYIVL